MPHLALAAPAKTAANTMAIVPAVAVDLNFLMVILLFVCGGMSVFRLHPSSDNRPPELQWF
jgi:hypothetical protein